MKKSTALFASICAFAATAPASSQDFSRNPSFGTVTLTGGFTGDPRTVRVTAGGTLDATTLGSGCVGSMANAPDVRLQFTASGSLPLIISVASDSDTTLAINQPDGSWICDDDGGENGTNPAIRFSPAASGQYDIYIGHYAQGRRIPATLYISEISSQ
jgi:hypothetical protein